MNMITGIWLHMYVLLFCLQLCYFLPCYASHDPCHGSDFSLLFLFHAAGFWKVLLPIIPISSFFLLHTSLISRENWMQEMSLIQLTSGRPLAERAWFWNWAAGEGWASRGPESYLGQSRVVQKHHTGLDKSLSLFSLYNHKQQLKLMAKCIAFPLLHFGDFYLCLLSGLSTTTLPLPPRC